MKKRVVLFLAIFFLLIILVIIACDKEFVFHEVDCSNCYPFRPENSELIIKVTINNENQAVPIEIYRDKIESGRLRLQDTVTKNKVYIEVPLNHYYSVIAKYKVGNDSVFAVDGDRIKTQRVTDQCDTTCWIITGGKYDVRLKEKAP